MSARGLGISALQAGQVEQAVRHLEEAVATDPRDTQAWGYLGTAYGRLQQFDRAVGALEKAVELGSPTAALCFNLGLARERSGNPTGAVAALRQALSLDPNYNRANEALQRLGQSSTPAAPTADAAGSAAGSAQLGDFQIGSPPPSNSPYGVPPNIYAAPAPVSPAAEPSPYGPPPNIYAPPPAPASAAPSAPPSIYGAPPAAFGGPAASPAGATQPGGEWSPAQGFQAGLQPMGDWTPPPAAGPQPLGDWTPPPGQNLPGEWAPQGSAPATAQSPHLGDGGPIVQTIGTAEGSLTRSQQIGSGYLMGMGMGVWWGLLGAIISFLNSTMSPLSQLGSAMLLTLGMVCITFGSGVLMFGAAGAIGAQSEDPEATCSWCGLGIAIFSAVIGGWLASQMRGVSGTVAAPAGLIYLWIGWRMGKGLGGNISEAMQQFFVVASGRGVSVTTSAR